jgi:hypothetical protein
MSQHHFYQIGRCLSQQYGSGIGELFIAFTNLYKRVEKLEMISNNLQTQTQTQTQRQTQIHTFRENELSDYHKLIEYQRNIRSKE